MMMELHQINQVEAKMPIRNNIDFTNQFRRLYFLLCKNCANSCEIVIDILFVTKERIVINLQLQAAFFTKVYNPAG